MNINGFNINLPPRYTHNSSLPVKSGGFGDVIFCNDEVLQRLVAIKILKDPTQFERINDEISALLKLRSKHVVQVYDVVDSQPTEKYLILEYINGEDLFTTGYPQQSLDNYLKTLWQVASGIKDIHDVGLIHRDIKPNNMKLDDEGIIKIFDFGLSRDEVDGAETIGFKGTHGFAAPELYHHSHVEFTKEIDIYAFGATALYLAEGDLPQELRKVTGPSELTQDVYTHSLISEYQDLIDILKKCLAQNPNERPDIGLVKAVLEKYLLKGKHQALAVSRDRVVILNADRERARLEVPKIGQFIIEYDGFGFYMDQVSGDVFINNIPVHGRCALEGSTVITVGLPELGMNRNYLTFDISNPEVAL